MKRIDGPVALSVLAGVLVGAVLLFLLAPLLKSSSIIRVLSETSAEEIAVRPTPPAGGLPFDAARPAVLRTPSPQQTPPAPPLAAKGTPPAAKAATPPPRAALPRQTVGPLPTTGGTERGPEATPPASIPTNPAPEIVQAPTPVPTEQGPQFMIQVGPIADRDRAAEIVNHLALIGLAAGMLVREEPVPPHFVVISDTVPLAVAERRAAALTQLGFHPQLRTLAGGYAQLRFGAFASQQEADRVARAVRITGFAFAAVVREGGTVYIITLGPLRSESVETVQRALRSRFRGMLPVAVSPTN